MKSTFLFFDQLVSILLFAGLSSFSSLVFASDLTVSSEKAALYSSPNDTASVGVVKRGKKIKASEKVDGFYRLKTKSGQPLYIKSSDVKERSAEADLISSDEASSGSGDSPSPSDDDFNRWNLSVSFSAGSYGEVNYSEAHLGIGYYFLRWLEFHNSLFANFNATENYYGLDTSFRGVLNANLGVAGIHAFAGPGYRFVTKTQNVPFAEMGVIARIFGLSLGGGVKTFFRSMLNSKESNENQYFIVLSGGASF